MNIDRNAEVLVRGVCGGRSIPKSAAAAASRADRTAARMAEPAAAAAGHLRRPQHHKIAASAASHPSLVLVNNSVKLQTRLAPVPVNDPGDISPSFCRGFSIINHTGGLEVVFNNDTEAASGLT